MHNYLQLTKLSPNPNLILKYNSVLLQGYFVFKNYYNSIIMSYTERQYTSYICNNVFNRIQQY